MTICRALKNISMKVQQLETLPLINIAVSGLKVVYG